MQDFLERLGIEDRNLGGFAGSWIGSGPELEVTTPIDGSVIAYVRQVSEEEADRIVARAHEAFLEWRKIPAPKRGEVVRQLGLALRENKEDLGRLVSLEMGKIRAEGEGEVQEMIDICDFATGLSRQLYGLTLASERADHHMREQWHPLGVVGVISAFNFPVAVWSWNAFIAFVCGDVCLWKPSEKTPLTALAVCKVLDGVLEETGWRGISNLVIGDVAEVGEPMLDDRRVPLVSATGSCRMGKIVGPRVAARLGRSLLELGGNNALVVMDDAELDLALVATAFGAVGTAGQRCTSTRRIICQDSVFDTLRDRLVKAYEQVKIGDPLDNNT